jgi:hypothetical protein
MRNATLLVAATALFAVISLPPTLDAQGGRAGGAQGAAPGGRGAAAPAVPAGPAPRLANGKPDLSGLWNNPYTPDMAGGRGGAVDPKTRQPLKFARQGEALPDAKAQASGRGGRTFDLPYTEWGLKQWKNYDPVNDGDYAGNCLPFGISRSMNSPHGTQIIHHPDAVAFLYEQNTWHHWVPTNASFKWPADLPPSWTGTSTGRWEGDTLVIETKNFNGYTRLDTSGHPHSAGMTIINSFTRTDANTMEHTVTVRDPKAYTQEWMNVRTWRIKQAPDVLMEYSCDENNLHGIIDGSIKLWKAPENLD